jgi:hypothetical protein
VLHRVFGLAKAHVFAIYTWHMQRVYSHVEFDQFSYDSSVCVCVCVCVCICVCVCVCVCACLCMYMRGQITTPARLGGNCGFTDQSESCNTAPCAGGCVVSPWSQWSDCTKPCGSGTMTRKRALIAAPISGKWCV